MSYIEIILTACLFFPILAFIITLPYIIYNYHKYGSILLIRTLLIYGFILYLLSAYFLVILPLPDIKDVLNIKTKFQLVPFNFISEIVKYSNFSITDPSTYLKTLTKPWVYQAIYNTLLTMPFAIFLRYYFNCKFKKTVLATFLLSLFFELTQLTGLYFIYPNAYRLFDVDDLIINTLGGVVGYIITPLAQKILPSKKELDLKSYKKGTKVSITRRIITTLIDLVVSFVFFLIIILVLKINDINCNYLLIAIMVTFLTFILIPLVSGQTIGCMITNIKIAKKDDTKAKWYQILLRNLLFVYVRLPMFCYIRLLLVYINALTNNRYPLTTKVAYLFILIIYSLFVLIRNILLKIPFTYEKLSKTKMVSTIKIPE